MNATSLFGLAQGLSSCEYVYLAEEQRDDVLRRSERELRARVDRSKLYRHNSISESLCRHESKKKSPRNSWTPVLRSKHCSASDISRSERDLARTSREMSPSPSKASQLLARFKRKSSATSTSAIDLRCTSEEKSIPNGEIPTTPKRPLRARLFRHISWSNVENKQQTCDNKGSSLSTKSSLSVFPDNEHSLCDNNQDVGCHGDQSNSNHGDDSNNKTNSALCNICGQGKQTDQPTRCECKPPIMKFKNIRNTANQCGNNISKSDSNGTRKANVETNSRKILSPSGKNDIKSENNGVKVSLRQSSSVTETSSSKLTPVKDILRRFSLRYRRKHELPVEICPEKQRPHSFVNSQEWTLARAVPDLKLGILGTTNSGKSALVHRYLTGSYMQDESPEGGRFKKEVMIDAQSYLLLIRDEGGPPEMQFTNWVDAVICVFSVENEMSFNAIYTYYTKMAHYRNLNEIPVILVGTQDAISESNPRVIDDARARKLAADLKRCSYYETCATYGLNVERVFQDACQKTLQMRLMPLTPTNSRPGTPNHSNVRGYYTPQPVAQGTPSTKNYDTHSSSGQSTSGSGTAGASTATLQNIQGHSPPFREQATPPQQAPVSHSTATAGRSEEKKKDKHDKKREKERERQAEREREQAQMQAMIQSQLQGHHQGSQGHGIATSQYQYQHHHQEGPPVGHKHSHAMPVPIPIPPPTTAPPPPPTQAYHPQQDQFSLQQREDMFQLQQQLHQQLAQQQQQQQQQINQDKMDSFLRDLQIGTKESPLTPILSRLPRVRSRSSLSLQKKGEEDKQKKNGETVGVGRVIPIKQGYLYKKSAKPLSKDWKKKYVTLLDDGRLTYHPSLHDYMDDVHGKEITLMKTTVKIPGQRPRGSRTVSDSQVQANGNVANKGRDKDAVVLTAFDQLRDVNSGSALSKVDDNVILPNSALQPDPESGIINGMDIFTSVPPGSKIETPNVKKRHKRAKSGAKNLDTSQDGADSDGYEFMIVSIENKQWHFEACSIDEREEWMTSIESQILCSLQGIESNKSKSRSNTLTDPAAGQAIRSVKGNQQCADCNANNPDWASLNLGALICIECSGIHRNLGTHVSRVRSLDLDEWPPEMVEIMKVMGNSLSNSIWEANTKGRPKPAPTSSREDKEKWIRAKYEQKEYLPPPPHQGVPVPQQLIDAVARQHVLDTALVLAHAKTEHVNAPYSQGDTRTALHIAAALGNVVLVQLLLWYGANVKTVDHEGRNALFYARSSQSTECVELLRNQGCPENPTLPRRRGSNNQQQPPPQNSDVFEKLPASVI